MNALFFVAETPRAGESGHRFILPPGCSEGSSLAAEFCRNAVKYGAGKNFVGVKQPVVQHLPNGAVRRGVETLVLVGVDYPRLDNDQKQHLRAVLTRRLADLETLVTQRIDWKREGQSLVVTRPEFGNWLREDSLVHFPCAPLSTGPAIERRRPRISSGIAVALVTIALVGGVSFFFSRMSDGGNRGTQTEDRKGQSSEALLKSFANEIGKSSDLDVALALYRQVHNNEEPSPSDLTVTTLLQDQEVSRLLQKFRDYTSKKINVIEFVSNRVDEKGKEKLQQFLGDNAQLSVKKALYHRGQFAQLRQDLGKLSKVRQDLDADDKGKLSDGTPFSSRLKNFPRTEQKTIDEKLVSPFFEERDIETISLLAEVSQSTEPSLQTVLDAQKDILTALSKEATTVRQQLVGRPTFADYTAACGALENFFKAYPQPVHE